MEIDFSSLVNKKKILLVLNGTLFPEGGMYEYANAWLDLLSRENWEIGFAGTQSVISSLESKFTEYMVPQYSHTGISSYQRLAITSLFGCGTARILLRTLHEHISDFMPSVVHISDFSLHTGFLLKNLSLSFPNINFVSTIHDPRPHEEIISLPAKILIKINNIRILSAANKKNVYLHVHSLSLAEGTPFSNVDRLIEVSHPLPRALATRRRPRITLRDEIYPIRVGFMGRIEPYKGLDTLFTALSQLSRDTSLNLNQLEVVIAGRGRISDDWLSLPTQVIMHNNFLTDLEFHQLMADLDVLLLPYHTATQSGVGLMGVTYGIPIVASDVGAIRGTVVSPGGNGVLIPPNDPSNLASCLKEFLTSPGKLIALTEHAISKCDNKTDAM